VQVGIREIIYLEDKYADTIGTQASKKMLTLAGIKLRQYNAKELKELI
jgi:dCMP deaminase